MWQLWHYNDGDYITIYDITNDGKSTVIAILTGADNGPLDYDKCFNYWYGNNDNPDHTDDHRCYSSWKKKIISSTSNKMLVELRTDDVGKCHSSSTCTVWNGFSASIHYSLLPSKKCEKALDIAMKTIQSPNYPDLYDNNLVCKWLISVPHSSHIALEFLQFHVRYLVSLIFSLHVFVS